MLRGPGTHVRIWTTRSRSKPPHTQDEHGAQCYCLAVSRSLLGLHHRSGPMKRAVHEGETCRFQKGNTCYTEKYCAVDWTRIHLRPPICRRVARNAVRRAIIVYFGYRRAEVLLAAVTAETVGLMTPTVHACITHIEGVKNATRHSTGCVRLVVTLSHSWLITRGPTDHSVVARTVGG